MDIILILLLAGAAVAFHAIQDDLQYRDSRFFHVKWFPSWLKTWLRPNPTKKYVNNIPELGYKKFLGIRIWAGVFEGYKFIQGLREGCWIAALSSLQPYTSFFISFAVLSIEYIIIFYLIWDLWLPLKRKAY